MTKKILLWVEDNPSETHLQLIETTAKKRGLILKHVGGDLILHKALLDFSSEDDVVIQGIILDLMIYGADSLSDFGYSDVNLEDASNVGEFLLKYVFRNTEPKQEKLAKLELPKKPVLILTVKSETKKDDFKEYGEQIELVHKYELDDNVDLDKVVRGWINQI